MQGRVRDPAHREDPRDRAGLSLRSVLTSVTVMVALLALVVCGALVTLTTMLTRTNESLAAAVESVRLAEEAEVDLLLHGRAQDALIRRSLEHDLFSRLGQVDEYVTTAVEAGIAAEARSRFAGYLAAGSASPAEREHAHQQAYDALEALVDINTAQSRTARAEAVRWNDLANMIGLITAGLVLAISGGLLWWVRRRAFQPVLVLARAMERFGRGERAVRAEEHGPTELREIARRFNQMAAALAAQREAQIAFLAGVAHDLRNPLGVLTISIGAVSADRPLPDEERLRRILGRIGRQISRLDRMVGDFLDMAKIEAGELDLQIREVDLCQLVRDVVDLVGAQVADDRIQASWPATPLPVACDALRIEQVLHNLLSNAIKYSPIDSGIELTVAGEEAAAVIEVRDHGIGISAADLRRLFEPFRRVGDSRSSVPGIGLGLHGVRRIVEAHGGRVEVDSRPGQGSRFRVHIPRVAAAGAGNDPATAGR